MNVKMKITRELFDKSVCTEPSKCLVANAINNVLKEEFYTSVDGKIRILKVDEDGSAKLIDELVINKTLSSLIGDFDGIEDESSDQEDKDRLTEEFFQKWLGKVIEFYLPEELLDLADIEDVNKILLTHKIEEYADKVSIN